LVTTVGAASQECIHLLQVLVMFPETRFMFVSAILVKLLNHYLYSV